MLHSGVLVRWEKNQGRFADRQRSGVVRVRLVWLWKDLHGVWP